MEGLKDKLEFRDVDEVTPYPNNPKEHPEGQVDKIAGSIKEFGFVQPIVVRDDDQIIIGHGRLLAAKRLGLDEIPVIKADHLTEAEARALRIADNKVSESDWEGEALAVEIEQLQESEVDEILTGFDDSEINEILGVEGDEEEGEKEKEGEVEFTPELRREHNYVVLFFETDVDWLQLKSILDLDTVKALHSKEGFECKGVGRVVNGPEALQKIKEELSV